MPGRVWIALVTVALYVLCSVPAAVAQFTFSNRAPISIPGIGNANPYPSSIQVSGLERSVSTATVTLFGFSHTCPNDVNVLLAGPTGANTILFAGIGSAMGCPPALGADLTFAETGPPVPYPPVTGTYIPTQGDVPPPFSPPAGPGPYPLTLGVFSGTPANGNWSLFVNDVSNGDSGSFSGGWSLTLRGPSPINSFSVGTPVRNKKKGTATLPVTVPNPGTVALAGTFVKPAGSSQATKAVSVAAPGTVNLVVRAKGKAKKNLNATGKAKVQATVTYTPTAGTPPAAGTPSSTVTKLKLKKRLG